MLGQSPESGQGTLTSAGAPARANHRPHSGAAPVYFNFLPIDPPARGGGGVGIDQLLWGGQSVWSARRGFTRGVYGRCGISACIKTPGIISNIRGHCCTLQSNVKHAPDKISSCYFSVSYQQSLIVRDKRQTLRHST